MLTIKEQQDGAMRSFIVWGTNQVPKWLRDYGAIAVGPAVFIDAIPPYDWVVRVHALPADINRYRAVDMDVVGVIEQGEEHASG